MAATANLSLDMTVDSNESDTNEKICEEKNTIPLSDRTSCSDGASAPVKRKSKTPSSRSPLRHFPSGNEARGVSASAKRKETKTKKVRTHEKSSTDFQNQGSTGNCSDIEVDKNSREYSTSTMHELINKLTQQISNIDQRVSHLYGWDRPAPHTDDESDGDEEATDHHDCRRSKRPRLDDEREKSDGELSDNESQQNLIQSIMIQNEINPRTTKDSTDDCLEQTLNDWITDDKGTTGPEVNERLAKLANSFHTNNSSKEKIEMRIKKYIRPKNCQKLVTPKINFEIFKQLSQKEQTIDKVLANIQHSGIAASISILQAIEEIRKMSALSASDANKILNILTDSMALQGHVFNALNTHRRENPKFTFKSEFSTICSNRTEVEDGYLFGTNLSKILKEMKEETRLAVECVAKPKYANGNGSQRRSYSSYSKSRGNGRQIYQNSRYDRQFAKPAPSTSQQKTGQNHFLSRNRFPVNRKFRGKTMF